jgi:TonB family protein
MFALISALTAAAGATPIDRASWFTVGDYPLEAAVKRMEGSVTFQVDVDADGKPIKCEVTKSSGQPILDQRTCEVALSRAHFKPALDAKGKPIPGQYSTNVTWKLAGGAAATYASGEDGQAARTLFSAADYPVEALKNGWEGEVVADLTVSPEGRVTACAIVKSSGHDVLDQATCDIVRKRAVFKPAIDANGKPIEDHVRTPPIKWALSNSAATSLPSRWQQLAPGHILCSEPAGHADAYAIPSLVPGKPIRFRFRLVSENYDPTYSVNAALVFETPAGEMLFQVGKPGNDQHHIFVALHGADKDPENWVILELWAATDDWITTKMELDSRGVIRIVTENGTGTLALGTAQPVPTSLECNSGVFEVEMSPTSSVLHALRP